ncbi:MAG: sulfate ABC transporter ATP-binding protein [Myxococcales bacterium 68-20]|nr:MAG: sulfate ABC transporter ATP-binding protein [Myxococcales bacterium 68-20]
MISVQHLVKRYGWKVAVDDLSFEVDKGEVVGFLGPNGAGKSTTLRVIAGFLGATSGTVKVAGHDIAKESFEARQKLGYMPEAVPLYPEMRVVEYLSFRAELKRVPRGDRKRAVWDAMGKANVRDVANVVIGHLSKGYRQRVGLADALVGSPPLLVLDEPTAGLDPNQIREVREVIQELGKEHTVLLSTHILSEVEASCSRVVVIAGGKLVAEGSMDEIAKKRRSAGLHMVVRGNLDAALAALRGIEGITKATRDHAARTDGEDVFAVRCSWSKKLDEAAAARATEAAIGALVGAGLFVREASPVKSSLEELFGELTGARAEDASGEAEPDDAEAAS